MTFIRFWVFGLVLLALTQATSAKNVAYIHGDVAANGTIPSGAAAAYDPMLLTDSGNNGCSQFKAMVEGEGYTISQHYDQTLTLDATFLGQFDVVVFGLHQRIWSTAEQLALDAWLQAGGGILMYSDSASGGFHGTVGIGNPTGQNAANSILSNYGMQVAVDQGGGTRAYRSDANSPNPIVWDQPIFEGEGVSPVAIDPAGNAQALIPFDNAHKVSGGNLTPGRNGITIANPTWAALALSKVGDGNVMAIFDRQPLWNNGPGSDINEEDNKEILRRSIRYLAQDYGNSSEWLNLIATDCDLSYRQWTGGAGTPGFDYTARNNRFAVQQRADLLTGAWSINSNWTQVVSSVPEANGETEITTVRLVPALESSLGFARIALLPATNTVPPNTVSNVVRAINCGGSAYAANSGINYEADTLFSGGHIDSFPGNSVANTTDDALYNTARSGHSAYNIPLANGDYTVRLQFAETFFTDANKRVFDTSIEGMLVLNDLDLFVTAPGKWVADDRIFSVTVADGMLNLAFSASVNNALLNAIVVMQN